MTLFDPLIELSVSEIRSRLLKMKRDSPEEDVVPQWVYKCHADILSEPNSIIFNRCLADNPVPETY
jgi:hypothetical protein